MPWSIYCIFMCVVISARNERCIWIDTDISVFRGLSARKRLFKAEIKNLKCFKCPFTQRPHLYPRIPFVQKFLARTNFPLHLQNLITLLYSDHPRFSSQCQSSKEIKKQEGRRGGRVDGLLFLDANCMCLCGCLTCVPLIIAEHGVAFDSRATLTARRLAEASRMTGDQRRQAGKQKSSWEKIRRGTTSTRAIVKERNGLDNFFPSIFFFFFSCENLPFRILNCPL